ncbi:hypothetical protein [Aliagarivorans marinus]|uniref:hypothetical protein n=1 Tax=Aliagarivorans marinus TaxID=561965 RepID=UPI00040FB735|nr:hypothetical protein [Aliagarivorans marinus]
MKLTKLFGLTAAALSLAACQSTPQPSQTTELKSSSGADSKVIVGKSAYNFEDKDIEVPAYFNTQGLQFCSYESIETDSRCPLAKKTIRIFFGDVNTSLSDQVQSSSKVFEQMHNSIGSFNSQALNNVLETQFAGVNRFRILASDTSSISEMLKVIMEQEGADSVANKLSTKSAVSTDYVMKVDVIKTGDMLFGSKQSLFQTSLDLTAGIIDPYTSERLSYPNVGKIRVSNFDVRDKGDFTTVIANGNYYRGFNYTSEADVGSVLNEMASRSFDIMLSRLLTEMPATAQVLGIKDDRISLDRGQNAGILPNETMVVFEYSAGFVEPVGVAKVNPSAQSAQGQIIRWKKAKTADSIKQDAKDSIYRPNGDRKLFAVSVGVPAEYLKERSVWDDRG